MTPANSRRIPGVGSHRRHSHDESIHTHCATSCHRAKRAIADGALCCFRHPLHRHPRVRTLPLHARSTLARSDCPWPLQLNTLPRNPSAGQRPATGAEEITAFAWFGVEKKLRPRRARPAYESWPANRRRPITDEPEEFLSREIVAPIGMCAGWNVDRSLRTVAPCAADLRQGTQVTTTERSRLHFGEAMQAVFKSAFPDPYVSAGPSVGARWR